MLCDTELDCTLVLNSMNATGRLSNQRKCPFCKQERKRVCSKSSFKERGYLVECFFKCEHSFRLCKGQVSVSKAVLTSCQASVKLLQLCHLPVQSYVQVQNRRIPNSSLDHSYQVLLLTFRAQSWQVLPFQLTLTQSISPG